MGKESNLIDDKVFGSEFYNYLKRDRVLHENIENIWAKCRDFLDADFRVEFPKNVQSRFWEMFLVWAFIDNSKPIQKRKTKESPDILIECESYRIWVEATAPKEGECAFPEWEELEAVEIPEEEIISRYTSAIKEKFGKYMGYISKGIVLPTDSFIIAICSDFRWGFTDQKAMLKTIYPLGYPVLHEKRWGYTHKPYIHKPPKKNNNEGKKIDIAQIEGKKDVRPLLYTEYFVDQKYEGISGVIYSSVSPFMFDSSSTPYDIKKDFIYYRNPLAINKVPDGFFSFCYENPFELPPKKDYPPGKIVFFPKS